MAVITESRQAISPAGLYPMQFSRAGNARFASTPRDYVTFGSTQAAKTEAEKLAQTQKEAFELFTQNPTREKLLEAVKKKFQEEPTADGKIRRLEIFDGRRPEHSWVNQVCDAYGNVAFFQPPDSLLYHENPRRKIEFTDEDGKFSEQYTKDVMPRLFRQQKLAIYISKDADMGTLMHEIFHALQFKNGLPMATTLKTDDEALKVRNQFNEPVSSQPAVNSLWRMMKGVYHWLVTVPYLLIKRKLTVGQAQKQDQANQEPTVGEALRVNMRREKEVDKFLIRHGGALGLSMMDRLTHLGHYIFESKLQELLSYRLD